MSVQMDLWVYCDLTEIMLEALHHFDVEQEELSRYNLERMRKLLTADGKGLNAHGRMVLQRARDILDGSFVKEKREKPTTPPADAAKAIRRDTIFKRMKSIQVKALYDLWEKPGQGWHCIMSTYGYDNVAVLLAWKLILGEAILGSPLELNGAAIELLVKFCGVRIELEEEVCGGQQDGSVEGGSAEQPGAAGEGEAGVPCGDGGEGEQGRAEPGDLQEIHEHD